VIKLKKEKKNKLNSKIFLRFLIIINNKIIIKINKKKEVLSPEINNEKKYNEKKIDIVRIFFFKLNLKKINIISINGNKRNKKLPKINSLPKKLDALDRS
jgi:hypothetical protein